MSAVCKKWYRVVMSVDFGLKIKETNSLFYDKDWLLKTYYKHFERFKDSVYFECVSILHYQRLHTIEKNIINKIFYSVLPFRSGLIFGSVVGLKMTVKYVSIVQSCRLGI